MIKGGTTDGEETDLPQQHHRNHTATQRSEGKNHATHAALGRGGQKRFLLHRLRHPRPESLAKQWGDGDRRAHTQS